MLFLRLGTYLGSAIWSYPKLSLSLIVLSHTYPVISVMHNSMTTMVRSCYQLANRNVEPDKPIFVSAIDDDGYEDYIMIST